MIHYKALVESLANPNITKRAYDDAIKAINGRVDEIWRFICAASKRKLHWWAFQNDLSLGHGDGSTGGFFEPKTDSDFIAIGGDRSDFFTEDFTEVDKSDNGDNPHYNYQEGFPTELLWDDNWQTTIQTHIAEAVRLYLEARTEKLAKNKAKKEKEKEKAKRRQQRLQDIFDKTKSVLTEEEHNWMVAILRQHA